MIRITIELHVVSRGEDGGYWLSNITPQEWNYYKTKRSWCENDAELRYELTESSGYFFMFARDSDSLDQAIGSRVPFVTRLETIDSQWPMKADLERELSK